MSTHRFIGGYGEVKQEMSPVRTVETYAYTLLNRPCGTIPFGYYRPSHEWLGYCRLSLRDFFNSPTVTVSPVTLPAAMMVMVEVILGYIMPGMLISVLANKVARARLGLGLRLRLRLGAERGISGIFARAF